ncbi:thermonuclease family protein [Pseudomonas zhanjiangensis]|uniref:Thermonuclease family protein n=1 Tax=Pseudomonas zhanjiangensis TaxID=3239015 RepID=A0ABV3YRD9_9PSED
MPGPAPRPSRFARRRCIDRYDRYGRTVGHAYVDGVPADRETVVRGSAWAYRQYNSDQYLIDVEQPTKANRLGLWGLAEAEVMPPREWRKAGNTTTGHLRMAFLH